MTREKAVKILSPYKNSCFGDAHHGGVISVSEIIELLSAQPEQKFGKWVDDGDPLSWVCSECGYRVARYNNTPYCPNCGAKMINANRDCVNAMLKR